MITYFIGEIVDVYESTYTKKDTGEVVKQYEVTATYTKRSTNGKLYMYTEHFRYTEDQAQNRLLNALGKYIFVPIEKRHYGKELVFVPNNDLGFEILEKNPFEISTPKPVKKAS